MGQEDNSLVERFRGLIRKTLSEKEVDKRMLNIRSFASRLSTHPNHLNAVVKRKTQKTAIEFVHEQVLHEARSLLSQTQLSVKEISFRIGYSDVAQDVLNKSVPAFGLKAGKYFTEYDLIYIHDNLLFNGSRNVDGRPFDKPENRPTNLQVPLVRK